MTPIKGNKYTKLMDVVGWKNKSNWSTTINPEDEILLFKDWLKKHLTFVVDEAVYTAMWDYYFKDVSLTPGSTYQKKLEQGRVAIAALYSYQKIGVSRGF